MPRLPVWFAATFLASAGYYTFYYQFYVPRYATRNKLEMIIEVEKSKLQFLLQRYAILQNMIKKIQQKNVDMGNQERLYIYCELQQLRESFYNLPLRSQSVSEKIIILQELDKMERKYCTLLNFRDEALTMWQMLICQICFSVYMICFHIFDPVLRQMPFESVERTRRYGLHVISRWILHSLSIPVTMTLENPHFSNIKNNNDNNNIINNNNGGSGGKMEKMGVNEQGEIGKEEEIYLAFNPQHWIELVGFWACSTNPLLSDMRIKLLSKYDAVPYEVYWHERWQWIKKDLLNLSQKSMEDEKDKKPIVYSSFGYPLATHLIDMGKKENDSVMAPDGNIPRLCPVVSHGMPRVLFVNNTVARKDVMPRRRLHEVYSDLHQRQFPAIHTVSKNNKIDESVRNCDTTYKQLRAWRENGSVPFWHPVEWGSIFGGLGRSGNRDRRELIFRIGHMCSATELITRQLQLQQQMMQKTERGAEEVNLL